MTNDELNRSAPEVAIRHSSSVIEVSAALIFRAGQLLITRVQPDEHRAAGASGGHQELITGDHIYSIDDPRCLGGGETSGLASYAAVKPKQ